LNPDRLVDIMSRYGRAPAVGLEDQ
jgi:hypothetical protein